MLRRQKTRKNVPWRGWKAPGTHERTLMRKRCGNKCFLGPKTCNCFPICNPGTCKINKKGIWSAYIRAREYGSTKMHRKPSIRPTAERRYGRHRHTKKVYKKIAKKAHKMLY